MQYDGESGRVIPVSDLRDYFRETVHSAISNQELTIDDHASHYVVNLLTLFSRSDALYEDRGDYFGLPPLAILMSDANAAERDEIRTAALQRLGDIALFVAGFFADSLSEKLVDLDYYIGMGGGAYRSLAEEIRGTARGRAMGRVFAELSVNFQSLVDVLNEVSDATQSATDRDIVRLYAVWQKTGSPRAARLLKQLDVVPIGNRFGKRH